MVEIAKWGKINQSKFWDFVGLSLFNISIGISVNISQASSFSLGNSEGQIKVVKAAVELVSEASQLEEVANSINPKNPRQKQAVREINADISQSKDVLNKIVQEEF